MVYCYKYILFMKVWVVQNESIIDTQEIIYMILILSYIFPSKYERPTKSCRRLFQGVKIFSGVELGSKIRYFDPRIELGYLLVVSIKAL